MTDDRDEPAHAFTPAPPLVAPGRPDYEAGPGRSVLFYLTTAVLLGLLGAGVYDASQHHWVPSWTPGIVRAWIAPPQPGVSQGTLTVTSPPLPQIQLPPPDRTYFVRFVEPIPAQHLLQITCLGDGRLNISEPPPSSTTPKAR